MRKNLGNRRKRPDTCRAGFDVETKRNRVKELEFEMADPDFWKNRDVADVKIKEIGELNDLIKKFDEIEDKMARAKKAITPPDKDVEGLYFLVDKDARGLLDQIQKGLRQLEMENLFTGKYDKQSAIISIFSGAGGQDAEDWAGILAEMYLKFSNQRGWKAKIIHETFGDFQSKTGRHLIKNITFEAKGDYAYGYLKRESGVHRLVRISPFSPEKKRHTSFALVEILPDLTEIKEEFKIPEEDLSVEFFRSSGPGGQNVNKVETAVRITHLPTGIAVASQAGRSQSQNRERAIEILKAKLIKLMEENKIKEINQLKIKVKPEWGNQIRSYVLQPYRLVKDHRTNVETAQVDKVLDGDLDMFIESEIK